MLPQHLFGPQTNKKKEAKKKNLTRFDNKNCHWRRFSLCTCLRCSFFCISSSCSPPPLLLLAVCFSCFLLTIRSHDTNWLLAWPARFGLGYGSNHFGFCLSLSLSLSSGAGATNPVNTESLLLHSAALPLRCSWPIIAH